MSGASRHNESTWLTVIIPVYQESDSDLVSLLNWIEVNDRVGIEWIIACAVNDKCAASLLTFMKEKAGVPGKDQLSNVATRLTIKESHQGRSAQMNSGASCASGQLLLFLHADTRLGEKWQEHLSNLVPGSSAWGSFTPAIDRSGLIYRIAEKWGLWRSRILGLPYGDQAIFISKKLYERSGGFDEKVQFMEDVDLAQRLSKMEMKPRLLSVSANTSARRWEEGSLRQSTRNLLALIFYCVGIPRSAIRSWYTNASN